MARRGGADGHRTSRHFGNGQTETAPKTAPSGCITGLFTRCACYGPPNGSWSAAALLYPSGKSLEAIRHERVRDLASQPHSSDWSEIGRLGGRSGHGVSGRI